MVGMKITFWGTRGTYPVPGEHTQRYGGNTPCVEVRTSDGSLLILDAGTGVRPLGRTLFQEAFAKGQGEAFFLLSDTHWDHVQGFPFFGPAFIKGNRFHIYAPKQDTELRSIFLELTYEPYFPVPLDSMGASFGFHEIRAKDQFQCGSAKITCVALHHPRRVTGYRIEDNGAVLVYFPSTAPNEKGAKGISEAIVQGAKDADLLIFDTTLSEQQKNSPWSGHSTARQAMEIAKAAKVKRLALFHYDPEMSDTQIDHLLATLRQESKVLLDASSEGWSLKVTKTGSP
jgi:phosphoribosyl 1,2-cyclic phosphodiesterase